MSFIVVLIISYITVPLQLSDDNSNNTSVLCMQHYVIIKHGISETYYSPENCSCLESKPVCLPSAACHCTDGNSLNVNKIIITTLHQVLVMLGKVKVERQNCIGCVTVQLTHS
jgi:hypothetical protein